MSPLAARRWKILGLAALVAAACAVWFAVSASRRVMPTPSAARTGTPRKAPAAQPASWPQWGGALNSAPADGAGFFDRARAREFAASVAPGLRKYIVELNARSLLPLPGPEHAAAAFADESAQRLPARAANNEQRLPVAHSQRTAYLQFVEHPSPDQRAQLAASGVELLTYTSGYAWTARGPKESFTAALKLDFVRAVARVDARDKLHPQVFSMMRGSPSPSYALAGDGRTRFRLLATAGTTRDGLLRQYDALGDLDVPPADVRAAPASVLGPRFEVVARKDLAQQLAAAPAVAFVELVPPPVASRDATTDVESNISDVRDSGLMLDGTGVTVAVREIGSISAHVDFDSRLLRTETGSANATDVEHATAVTGQIGSGGVTQPAAKGVAPNVSLLGYAVSLGIPSETFSTTDILDAATRGSRISNHSYGPAGISVWGDYQTISADWDAALRTGSLVACFAGNEEIGGQSKHIDYFVGAKNGICVSATNVNARAGNISPPIAQANGIAAFSEFGPMNDGRVKPDLVAFGDGVTLDQDTNLTTSIMGTSFAAPAVTGVAALAFQRYRAVVGAEPSGQLLKALLSNSATDLGQPGPDQQYGFGIVNAEEAINTVNLRQSADNTPFLEGIVTNGVTQTYTVNLQSAATFKATLCWLDVAGVPAAAKALVNDLDLEIHGPDGKVYYPYSLDPTKPTAAATNTVPNTVDNVEQITVALPANGAWTVLVKGTSIPSGDQVFCVCLNQPTQQPVTPPPSPGTSLEILASPESGVAPLRVSFAPLNVVNGLVYQWSFGDGTSLVTGTSVEHVFLAPGAYEVRLTATDALKTETMAPSKMITVDSTEAFPKQARLKLNFAGKVSAQGGSDDLQFTLVAGDLVRTPQQARDALHDGVFEGVTYTVKIAGQTVTSVILDRRASYKTKAVSAKLNLVKGEIDVRLKGFALAQLLGIDQTSTPPQVQVPVELVGASGGYHATFTLSYKSNGKTGSGMCR